MALKEPERAKVMLTELQGQATEALETLRDLARGIYPFVLAEKGLGSALTAQARKFPMTVDVLAGHLRRHPSELEGAVYFTVLEALQNVAKYAGATRTVVRLEESDDTLTFSVADDGAGFDRASRQGGSGLLNMADRIEALGGTLRITSASGQGTTISGRIPLGPSQAEPGQEPAAAAVQASASRSGPNADLGM